MGDYRIVWQGGWRRMAAFGIGCLLTLVVALGSATSSASAVSFGVVWPGDYGLVESEMDIVQRSGATQYHMPLDKSLCNKNTGWEPCNRYFEKAWQNGITILPGLVRSNEQGTQFLTSSSPEWNEWWIWAKEAVERYGYNGTFWEGKANPKPVTAWQVWNEPNLPANNPGGASVFPQSYANLVVWTAAAIQQGSQTKAGINTKVLFGGLYLPVGFQEFIEKAWQVGGLPGSISGISIHPYSFGTGGIPGMKNMIEGVHILMSQLPTGPSKTLWITELGWQLEFKSPNGIEPVTEAQQATLLRESFDWIKSVAASQNIEFLAWYNMRDVPAFQGWAYRAGLRGGGGDYRKSWVVYQEETGAPAWPPPAVVTGDAPERTETETTITGTVDPHARQTSFRFEWGTSTAYGNSIPVPDADAGSGNGTVVVSKRLTGLQPRMHYHYRLVATNAAGTVYGSDRTFTTGVRWLLRDSNSAGAPSARFWFGVPGEIQVSGDWDGDGVATPGSYNPDDGTWKLRNSNTSGSPQIQFQYGGGPWRQPVVGDWDGDGDDTIGVYDPAAGNWNLRNTNSAGAPNISFQYGGGVWKEPIAGDWDGDGDDTIGVYDPAAGNWNLRNTNSAGAPNISFQYGGGSWSDPVVGDWDGDGDTTIGVHDPSAGNWNLRNTNGGGAPDISFQFGGSQVAAVAGDWDGDGDDTIGVTDSDATVERSWLTRNSNTTGTAPTRASTSACLRKSRSRATGTATAPRRLGSTASTPAAGS